MMDYSLESEVSEIRKDVHVVTSLRYRFLSKFIINSILFIFGISIGFFLYFHGSVKNKNTMSQLTSSTVPINDNPTRSPTSVQQTPVPTGESTQNTYTSLRYQYSFSYPSSLKLITQTSSNNANTVDAAFVSQDTQYSPQGGWATSGIQLTVIVDSPEKIINPFATSDNSFLPQSPDPSKLAIAGYVVHNDGIGYIANVTTTSLADKFNNTPAVVSFVCFSPSSDQCKAVLYQLVSSFKPPQS